MLQEEPFLHEHSFHAYNTYRHISLLVKEGSIINVTNNKFKTFASNNEFSSRFWLPPYNYPPCYFQYIHNPKSNVLENQDSCSIMFHNNSYENSAKVAYKNLPLTHCSWLSQSAFNVSTTMPLEINRKYIKHIDKSGTFDMLP